ncbi:hypothetical protein [Christiangramia sp. SM2212]|uniref:Uncharacterized protein n=1 Tax=Christiangramia sediminicola TaxID=3073267 RepID=A0ABU1ET33_9FLAO|nr:hypothetical protein [Christiangramia sp. SM2212]MDR5591555.1 hypothetical protein [Christiangramia sp. SM2212]
MYRLIYFLLIISIISCKSEQDSKDSIEDKQDTTAFQKKLKIEEPQFTLEPEARKYALNWVEYITAQNEIRQLEDASINDVMNNAPLIAQIMESLKNSVPDSLRSVAVESRLNVVNTKAQLLKQYSGKQEPDAEEIAQTTQELHSEFTNLKLQMNEIFLKSLEDFEKELDEFEKLEREQDSISEDF